MGNEIIISPGSNRSRITDKAVDAKRIPVDSVKINAFFPYTIRRIKANCIIRI